MPKIISSFRSKFQILVIEFQIPLNKSIWKFSQKTNIFKFWTKYAQNMQFRDQISSFGYWIRNQHLRIRLHSNFLKKWRIFNFLTKNGYFQILVIEFQIPSNKSIGNFSQKTEQLKFWTKYAQNERLQDIISNN